MRSPCIPPQPPHLIEPAGQTSSQAKAAKHRGKLHTRAAGGLSRRCGCSTRQAKQPCCKARAGAPGRESSWQRIGTGQTALKSGWGTASRTRLRMRRGVRGRLARRVAVQRQHAPASGASAGMPGGGRDWRPTHQRQSLPARTAGTAGAGGQSPGPGTWPPWRHTRAAGRARAACRAGAAGAPGGSPAPCGLRPGGQGGGAGIGDHAGAALGPAPRQAQPTQPARPPAQLQTEKSDTSTGVASRAEPPPASALTSWARLLSSVRPGGGGGGGGGTRVHGKVKCVL